jgi:hypothetical protein
MRDGRPKFATNAFFFQEGDAGLYEAARYGEFRVDDGELLLTGLRGPALETTRPVLSVSSRTSWRCRRRPGSPPR